MRIATIAVIILTGLVNQSCKIGWGVLSECFIAKTARKKIPGDFNEDGLVDFNDFLLFTAAFSTREGDQEYREVMDIDKDGAITFSDFIIFVSLFKQTG